MESTPDPLRYPIGRFVYPREVSDAEVRHAIHSLAEFPGRLREAVESLPDSILDTPYRPSGWTVRQVVHHCADSHLNALVRFKLALTEASPVIKPYRQDAWAELPDSRMPVGVSLDLLAALHARWTALLDALTAADWDRPYIHPEHPDPLMLRQAVLQCGWHGEHHLAQILNLLHQNNTSRE